MRIVTTPTLDKPVTPSSIDIRLTANATKYQEEGNLVFDYRPLHNLRLSEDKNGLLKGQLDDFETDKLAFSINNPVHIECQPSYDGTVNLIINDDKNPPRLINSRFTVTENQTYKIIDREGDNDTNIYDEGQLDTDISLYKRSKNIIDLQFVGLGMDGQLKVGNYNFYFSYTDADGNESEIIEESGVVTCHIGNLNDPRSIQGGLIDEDSKKSAQFQLSNVDTSYEYLQVYYTRNTGDSEGAKLIEARKVLQKYPIRGPICFVTINGYEVTEEISINDLNIQHTTVNAVKTTTQCQNRLFLGNIEKDKIDYKELSDLALHFTVHPVITDVGNVDGEYSDSSGKFQYYNANNIYNKLGYWNKEIYRLGVVFVLQDGSLSPVFNIRGKNNITDSVTYENFPVIDPITKERSYIKINESNYLIGDSLENSKGVVRFNVDSLNINDVLGLKIRVDNNTTEYLRDSLKVNGFFFVRQKRIPDILSQAFIIGVDNYSQLPATKIGNGYLYESFIDKQGNLNHAFEKHQFVTNEDISNSAALCPDFEMNQSLFNAVFTGGKFKIVESDHKTTDSVFLPTNTARLFALKNYTANTADVSYNASIVTLGDGDIINSCGSKKFRAYAGDPLEAWRFKFICREENLKLNNGKYPNNIIRGLFGPYLGLEGYSGEYGKFIDIYKYGYSEALMQKYFEIRYNDSSTYQAIGNRIDINTLNREFTQFRGDCFICNFTHRMIRNFQDPSTPVNDDIVEINTWKNNYHKTDAEKYGKINSSDVNAVQLGHWVTFKVRSNFNLSMRCEDTTHTSERALVNKARSFYPLSQVSATAESKIPESSVINKGQNVLLSEKYNFEKANVPYIKNEFDVRVLYSDINVTDAFKNNFRSFKFNQFMDYPRTYGSIVKLVEFYGNIICVFENGVGLIPVNERTVNGSGDGGNVFINTSNVLPMNPKILSGTFGSLWPESIIKTQRFVYGIDTVARKIWRTNGEQFECISDFKVQSFLNDALSLERYEQSPIIGLRNVKTHFNQFKQDVMFTFYNQKGHTTKAWNLCFNELQNKFITYYSWIPSQSENINNIFFTFDHEVDNNIASIWQSVSDGIVVEDNTYEFTAYSSPLKLVNRALPTKKYKLSYEFIDGDNDNKLFEISMNRLVAQNLPNKEKFVVQLKAVISEESTVINDPTYTDYINGFKQFVVTNESLYSTTLTLYRSDYLAKQESNFWKHGRAGVFRSAETIKPTNWFGKQHPFEFEFVVADNPGIHKVFEHLYLLSNKAAPESFHFEISGDVFEWNDKKEGAFIRQEATRHLQQSLGSNIKYDKSYLNLTPNQGTEELPKSILFSGYYTRVPRLDGLTVDYSAYTEPNNNYIYLSGTEVVRDSATDEFKLVTHKQAEDIKKVGRSRGNMNYQEDRWQIQIPSIVYFEKNETAWPSVPPINLTSNPLPTDLPTTQLAIEDLPKELREYGYNSVEAFDITEWPKRSECKIKDKYVKIKVRYSGEDLAIISAITTFYNLSYA